MKTLTVPKVLEAAVSCVFRHFFDREVKQSVLTTYLKAIRQSNGEHLNNEIALEMAAQCGEHVLYRCANGNHSLAQSSLESVVVITYKNKRLEISVTLYDRTHRAKMTAILQSMIEAYKRDTFEVDFDGMTIPVSTADTADDKPEERLLTAGELLAKWNPPPEPVTETPKEDSSAVTTSASTMETASV